MQLLPSTSIRFTPEGTSAARSSSNFSFFAAGSPSGAPPPAMFARKAAAEALRAAASLMGASGDNCMLAAACMHVCRRCQPVAASQSELHPPQFAGFAVLTVNLQSSFESYKRIG